MGYFEKNREFWQYYRSGARVIDGQFTKAFSRERIFEPLSLVIDPEASTLASYRAAGCLAMCEYNVWLREEGAELSVGTVSAADLGYSWGASDADLAEWLFGSRRWELSCNRKKERLAFSKKMSAALEKKWNEAERKFE